MKPGTLLISLMNHRENIVKGAIYTPFVPVKGTICTLERQSNTSNLYMEELKVVFKGEELGFDPLYWKELQGLPSIEEITEMVEECQLQLK